MKLHLDGQPFTVEFGPISKKRRRLLARANAARGRALLKLYEDFPDVKAYFALPAAERPALSDALAIQTAIYNSAFGDIEEDFNFAVVRGCIDTTHLTPDQRQAVLSEIDSDFWEDQIPKEIAAEVERFLAAIASTGSSNPSPVSELGDPESAERIEAAAATDYGA